MERTRQEGGRRRMTPDCAREHRVAPDPEARSVFGA